MLEVRRQHFFVWEHSGESLEKYRNKLNTFYLTVNFTADYS